MSFVLMLALTAAPLPDGEFWIPRQDTKCERIEVKGTLVQLGEFFFNQRDGKIFSPSYSTHLRHVPLRGSCMDDLAAEPRFTSREACRASCDGGVCPFVALPTCDPEMKAMRALAYLALDVEHEDAVKTMNRFNAATKKGGKLWESGSCAVVTVKPVKGGRAVLQGATWSAEGVFEPLFIRARLDGSNEWDADGGGLGLRGTSAQTVPLLVGRNLMILDRRVLFVDEGVCVAEGKKL